MGETKWKKRNSKTQIEQEAFTSDQYKEKLDATPFNMTTAPLQTVFDIPIPQQEGFSCNTSGIKSIKDKVKIVMDFLNKWFFLLLEYVLITGPTRMINELTDRICGDVTPKEKDLVRSHIKEFFATLLACYISYNWYYVMFYPRKLLPRPLLKISTDRLSNQNKWVSIVFKYLIVPMSFMNSILVNKIPFVLYPLDNKSKFLFLFYFIPKIILKHGAEIARGFVDSIRSKKTKRTGLFIAMMVFFGIISILRVRLSINYFSELFRFFTQIGMFFIPILVVFVLRIMFSSFNSWVAGILVFGYLLVISFFAMNIYGKTSNPLSIVYQINLQLYRKKPKRPPKPCDLDYYDEGGCTPKSFWQILTEFKENVSDFLFKYKFEVTFLTFFMTSFYNYIYKLNNGTQMKRYLVVLTFFGIFICFSSIGYRQFYLKKDYEAEYAAELKKKCDEATKLFGEPQEWLGCPPKEDDTPKLSIFERIYKVAMGEDVSDSEDEDEAVNKGMINTVISRLLGKPKGEGENGENEGEKETAKNPIMGLFSKFLPKKKETHTVLNSDQTIVKSYVPVQQIVYTTDPAFSSQPSREPISNINQPVQPLPPVQGTPPLQTVQGTQPLQTVQRTQPLPLVQGTVMPVQGTPPLQTVQGTVMPVQRTQPLPLVQRTQPLPLVQRTVMPVQGTPVQVQGTPPLQPLQRSQPFKPAQGSPRVVQGKIIGVVPR